MNKILKITCVLFIWQFSTSATADSKWTLALLMQTLSEVNTLKAEFEEVKTFSILSSDITVRGWLNYTKPNYIERQIVSPHRELTVIKDDVITIEREADNDENTTTGQQMSIDVHPAVRTLIESIRATFAGDLMVLESYYDILLSGTRQSWQLILVPIGEKVKEHVREVKIYGSDKQVNKIVTVESDDSESEITIVSSTFG